MKLKPLLLLAVLFLSIIGFVSGCGNKNNKKVHTTIEKKQIQPVRTSSIIKKLNTDMLDSIIRNRNGKILIVNLWSTWSGKSMNQLLILNNIYSRYKDRLVDFLTISIDAGKDLDTKVLPFLKKENIKLPVYTVSTGEGQKIMKTLNPAWNGSIPVIYIYNTKGIRKKILKGIQTQSDIEESINDVTN